MSETLQKQIEHVELLNMELSRSLATVMDFHEKQVNKFQVQQKEKDRTIKFLAVCLYILLPIVIGLAAYISHARF